MTTYSVSEDDPAAEICVVLRGSQISFVINLGYVTTTVTAGNLYSMGRAQLLIKRHFFLDNRDFQEVMVPNTVTFFQGSAERTCFGIVIIQDNLYENRESFSVTLSLGMDVTDVTIDPSVTEVFILDEERE